MRREHVRRQRDANHVPPIFFGLGVGPAPGRGFASKKAVGFGCNDALDALPQLGTQILPNKPRSEPQRRRPHRRLPTPAPRFAVRAFLVAGPVGGDRVANGAGRFAQVILAVSLTEAAGVFHQRAARQYHTRDSADALVHVVAAA